MSNAQPGAKILEQVDEGRRAAVRRFVGVAFAAPVVASFSLSGLGVNEAHAYASNNTVGPVGPVGLVKACEVSGNSVVCEKTPR